MSGDIFIGAAKQARDWVDYGGLVFTIIGVVILTAYTAAAFWQACLTRHTLVLSRRAWLVASLSGRLEITPGKKKVTVRVENVGGVPAVAIRAGGAEFVGAEILDRFEPIMDDNAEAAGYLGGSRTLKQFATITLDAQDCATIKDGSKRLFLYFEVIYSDAFAEERRSTSCWFYSTEFDRWLFAHRHNHIT